MGNKALGEKKKLLRLGGNSFLKWMGAGVIISIWYYFFLGISWRTLPCSIESLFLGRINYTFAQLGAFVLTSSLVGLTLILMICSNHKMKLKFANVLKFTIMSFLFSTFFSVLKLILNANYKSKFCGAVFDLGGIGHISFSFLVLGIFSFALWFILNFKEKIYEN